MSKRLLDAAALPPGGLHALEIDGLEILLARDQAGKLYALRDRCPHQQRSLGGGSIEGQVLTCRHHGVQIELSDGTVRYSAGYIGLESVRTYRVEERDGAIWLIT